jgi:hypothetical protein
MQKQYFLFIAVFVASVFGQQRIMLDKVPVRIESGVFIDNFYQENRLIGQNTMPPVLNTYTSSRALLTSSNRFRVAALALAVTGAALSLSSSLAPQGSGLRVVWAASALVPLTPALIFIFTSKSKYKKAVEAYNGELGKIRL